MKVVLFTAAVVASILVFVVDLVTPGGYAVGALYLVPLMAPLLGELPRWQGRVLVSLALWFTIVDYFLGAPGPSQSVTLFNRGVTLLAIAAVSVLVELSRRRAARIAAERKQADTLFDAALEAAPDALLVTEDSGAVRASNAAAQALFGYGRGELVGKHYGELVVDRRAPGSHSGSAEPGTNLLGAPLGAPGRITGLLGPVAGLRKGGGEVALEVTRSFFQRDGQRLCIAAHRDVSEKRKLEERLRSSQRMEAIGRLAGVVAHDFNNLLAVMMSYTHFIADALPPGDPVRADLDEVIDASERAANLTRQLLAFSRRQVVKPLRFAPGGLVHDMEKMLRRLIGENIELITVGFDGEGLVEIDPAQLEQVVLNLIINARDAMPQGGRITMELGNVTLDQAYCDSHPDVTPGDYLMLAVTDTGVGMSEDVRLRVFEPFFTTKGPGAGTGLGLSTVYGIVKQANGHIWVYSEPGHGSTFKAYFPRKDGTPDAMPAPRLPAAIGGTEVLLLVEDEAALRRVSVRVLKKAGYEVLEAANGLDALRKVETGVRIDLLITDVVMPMMGGRELATKLLERDPTLSVLYVSGYTENAIVHHGVLESEVIFLQKPFQPDELLRRVRTVLDARQAGRR